MIREKDREIKCGQERGDFEMMLIGNLPVGIKVRYIIVSMHLFTEHCAVFIFLKIQSAIVLQYRIKFESLKFHLVAHILKTVKVYGYHLLLLYVYSYDKRHF